MIIQTNTNDTINKENSNNETSIANSGAPKQDVSSSSSQPLIDLKNTNNRSNLINSSSSSSLAKSLLENNFNFTDSFQSHLDNLNGYDIHFGNLNKINDNLSNNEQSVNTSNIIPNCPIQNENKYVNNNSIYSNVFTSSPASNSSSSIVSFLAFNQVQPKSKVNVINSSFNNIFSNIHFSDLDQNVLNKERQQLSTSNIISSSIENTRNESSSNSINNDSSSNLMFGSLNISKSSNLQNMKGTHF